MRDCQDQSACSSSLYNAGPVGSLPLVRSGDDVWTRVEQLLVFNNRLQMSLRSLYSAQCERNSLKHKVLSLLLHFITSPAAVVAKYCDE